MAQSPHREPVLGTRVILEPFSETETIILQPPPPMVSCSGPRGDGLLIKPEWPLSLACPFALSSWQEPPRQINLWGFSITFLWLRTWECPDEMVK